MHEEKNILDVNMREIMKQFSSRPIAYHKISSLEHPLLESYYGSQITRKDHE